MTAVKQVRVLAGRYRIDAPIGRGGMGTVWRAHDEVLGRDVAIKELILPPSATEEEDAAARVRALQEAQLAARLRHANIVGIYDIIEDDDRPWIVMELLPYRSLAQVVQEDGPLPPQRVAELGLGVLAALRAAHDEGIVHRDVKPANILVGSDGRVVLTDFGIACIGASASLTSSGMLLGSPSYIAPERARGAPGGPASDLWGLGAALYAAVEGRAPFERADALSSMTAVVADTPHPVRSAGSLWPVISGLLAKDPDRRLSAAQAEPMLRQVAKGDTTGAATAAAMGAATAADAAGTATAPGATRTDTATSWLGAPVPPLPAAALAAAARPARRPGPRMAPPPGPGMAPPPGPGMAPPPGPMIAPPPGPPLPPRPRPDHHGSLRGLGTLAVIAAIIVAAGIAMVVVSTGGQRGHQVAFTPVSPRPGAASSGHAPSSPAAGTSAPGPAARTPAAPLASPASAPGALPPGYSRFTGPGGFSIGVPAGWGTSHAGHVVSVTNPANSGISLLIAYAKSPGKHATDPLAGWQQQQAASAGASAGASFPGYHLIRQQPVAYPQAASATDWEFTYDKNGTLTRVLDRTIVTGGGQAYALVWSAPQGDWSASYHYFQAFAATFQPAPAQGQDGSGQGGNGQGGDGGN